jgi:hypothetical protein
MIYEYYPCRAGSFLVVSVFLPVVPSEGDYKSSRADFLSNQVIAR